MVNISPAERNLCSRRREALLYIAGRFMAVHIDRCGKRKRASSQARKRTSHVSRILDKVSGVVDRGHGL